MWGFRMARDMNYVNYKSKSGYADSVLTACDDGERCHGARASDEYVSKPFPSRELISGI